MSTDALMVKYLGSMIWTECLVGKYLDNSTYVCTYVLLALTYHIPVQQY